MPTAYVLRRDDDGPFVQEWVLPPLAPLGFDQALIASASRSTPLEIEHCAVSVIVVTDDAAESAEFGQAVQAALRARTPVVAVYRGVSELPSTIVRELSTTAGIDVRSLVKPADLWGRLARLLPPPNSPPAGDLGVGEPLIWDEHAFSVLLAESVARNDFALGAALVERFERHLPERVTPYPAPSAGADLACLRAVRQFVLMRRYADAAITSGTTDFKVRRQFAQALIELGEFDEAVGVLEPLIRDTPARHVENYEARGLLGRAYKQRTSTLGAAPSRLGSRPRSRRTGWPSRRTTTISGMASTRQAAS